MDRIGYKNIIKQRDYMKLIFASLVNRFGDSVDAVASAWIVYQLTGQATWSALIYGMNLLPTVLITPFAGPLVEGRSKKKVMILTDLIRAVCVAYVATAFLLGFLREWHLIITTFVISTAEAFRTPAGSAMTPMVLKKEYYEYGTSLMMSLSTIVGLIGNGIAAGIIAFLGISGAIYIDMATFVLSALILSGIRLKEEIQENKGFDGKEYMENLKGGFQYMCKLKTVLFVCVVGMFLNAILVPLNSLEAPLVSEVLKGDATVLSVIGVLLSVGMLIGSAIFPMLRKRMSAKKLLLMTGGAISLFYLGMILCRPCYDSVAMKYLVVAVLTGVLGVSVSMTNSFASVEFMKRVEQSYLARCGAILTALTVAVCPVASLLLTGLTRLLDTAQIFILSGIISVVFSIALLFNKTLGKME